MNEEELLTKLMLLGFTKYEARVYVALLKHGTLTSTEIIKEAKIPQARLYDVIEKLISKGLVKYTKTRPIRYSLVDPSLALKMLVEREANEKLRIIEEVVRRTTTKPSKINEQYVWAVSGLTGIHTVIKENIREVQDELLLSTYAELVEKITPDIRELSKNRDVASCAILYDKYEHIIENLTLFDEVRYKPTLGPTIIVIDLTKAIVIPRNYKEKPVAYVIEDPDILTLIVSYYFYLKDNSSLLIYRLGTDIMKKSFRNLLRAIDMIRALKENGHSVNVEIDGFWVSTRKKDTIKGRPIDVVRDRYREITTLIIERDDGTKLSIGGYGATFEDFEARRITVYAIS